MRKCKKCGVDISYRGNRSHYCEKHLKEIRGEKIRQNESRVDIFFDSRRLSGNIEVD